jgi:hypothetical protein
MAPPPGRGTRATSAGGPYAAASRIRVFSNDAQQDEQQADPDLQRPDTDDLDNAHHAPFQVDEGVTSRLGK